MAHQSTGPAWGKPARGHVFSPSLQGQTLGLPQSCPLMSHWPELSHTDSSAARKAGKCSLNLEVMGTAKIWEFYYSRKEGRVDIWVFTASRTAVVWCWAWCHAHSILFTFQNLEIGPFSAACVSHSRLGGFSPSMALSTFSEWVSSTGMEPTSRLPVTAGYHVWKSCGKRGALMLWLINQGWKWQNPDS